MALAAVAPLPMPSSQFTARPSEKWHYKSAMWRRLAYLGAKHAPAFWVKYSPGWFGVAFAMALAGERAQIRDNWRRLKGERAYLREQWDVLRTFVNYAHCLAESLGQERSCAQNAKCVVHNEAALTRLLAEPKGFIVVTAHTGGWDIGAQVLMATSGRQVLMVMDREPDPAARELQDRLRSRSGLKVAHVGADALEGLALLKHLRQGGVVAVQLDRPPASGRCYAAELAGAPIKFPQGPFLLASLAQVPILPLFIARRGYYEYEVRVGNATYLPRRAEPTEIDGALRDIATLLESFLLDNPEQWFNFASSHSFQAGPADGKISERHSTPPEPSSL